jgi:hypothetical protein
MPPWHRQPPNTTTALTPGSIGFRNGRRRRLHVATQLVAAGISNPGKNKPLGAHVAHLRNIQHAFNTHHRQRSCGRA